MNISVKPYRATAYHDSDGEHLLVFRCTALDGSRVLEIGNHYVFASRKNRRLFSKRRSCELEVRMKRRSSVSDIAAATLKLSRDKIGELSFCPPTGADAMTTASAAILDASVFLDDQFFESLMSALLSGRRPKSLQLDLEKEGVIKYGWEPDGSRIEWKTQDPSAVSGVDVTRVLLTFELLT